MIMNLTARELMTAPIVTTIESSTIKYVRELMERKEIQSIPIVTSDDDLTIKGIITSTDLRGIADESQPVSEYMSTGIYEISMDADVEIAARMMLEDHVHHLIVMDGDKAVGIISTMDFVKFVAEHSVVS